MEIIPPDEMLSDSHDFCCYIYCFYRHLFQAGLLRLKQWSLSRAFTVGLYAYLSTLMLICAQSARVSGLERKTDLTSSARSSRKSLKDKSNRLLGIVKKFCISFGTEKSISICGGGGGVDRQ